VEVVPAGVEETKREGDGDGDDMVVNGKKISDECQEEI
jgi:hypothetical protein